LNGAERVQRFREGASLVMICRVDGRMEPRSVALRRLAVAEETVGRVLRG
jgi:hypothetical protein